MSEVCLECKFEYPSGILSPMVTSKGNYGPICGICALKITNEVHGWNLKAFAGFKAERMRQRAIKHRARANQ